MENWGQTAGDRPTGDSDMVTIGELAVCNQLSDKHSEKIHHYIANILRKQSGMVFVFLPYLVIPSIAPSIYPCTSKSINQ